MTMPVLGHPSLEESYPSLAKWSGSGPSRVKWAGVAPPAREISFFSLMAYGPKVSDSALAMGGRGRGVGVGVTASEIRQGGSQQYFMVFL